jgi:enediyne biosynthesis protein E4
MWSTGATMEDINADGWLDMYICSSGHMKDGKRTNKLYINQHNNTFKEEAAKYGLDISGYCTQASFFDYDMDGDLDCFIINNSPIPFSSLNYSEMRDADISKWQVAENLKGGGNHLLKNENGHFKEVTKAAGLHTGLISFGLGVTVGDINNDGYPDIYVGNDFIEKDYLYINQKNGTFKDELEDYVQKISMSSMSTDLGDINNDGYTDIFTTDMIPDDDYRLKTTGTFDNIDLYLSKQKAGLYRQFVRNCLQVNNGNGSFSEIGNYANVYGTDWSWGALFLDADNDGLNDIFVCNGIARDVSDLDFLDFFSNEVYSKMVETGQRTNIDELLRHIPVTPLPNRVFRNKGNFQFIDAGKEWGFQTPSLSNSVAYADLDNDGDLDLVVNNENQQAFVYRNNSREQTKNNYIGVELRSAGLNRFAVGSKIKVFAGGQVFYRELIPSRGFQSSVDYKQLIGLGKLASIDSMVIIWPDRTYTTIVHPQVNKVHVVVQPRGPRPLAYVDKNASSKTLFSSLPASFDRHREDDYIDFYYERNLPEMLSREGPHVAKGDVNGDGLEDIYIAGAKDQPGQLYIQSKEGKFIKKQEAVFDEFKDFEDVAVLFFDADKDGDLDLFIGSGGNNVRAGERQLEHRLYKNDGKGNFSIDAAAFPSNSMNIAVATAYDYDGDGDEDLFVGSRSVPFVYGQVPKSYLFQNDGTGHFKDVTPPLLSYCGMISSAVWVDINSDGRKELVVAGEWMAPRVFSYGKAGFEEVKNTGFENRYGWWQSMAAADLNGDGREDLILGNIGENFYLRPDNDHPVKLWVSDFDNNGTIDQFLTRSINGKDMPVFLKREVTDQFPFLKKENLKHSDYAKKSIQELFAEQSIKTATVHTFNYCSSVVAINNGKGGFEVKPLPVYVQLSSVNAICITDLNNDGKADLLLGGNMFSFPPQFGRLDASYGHVLLGDGKGNFNYVENKNTGLVIKGEIKDIKEIDTKYGKNYLVAQNDSIPVLLQLSKR